MLRHLFAVAFFCTVPLAWAQGAADPGSIVETAVDAAPAGKVELVEGDVRFLDGSGRVRQPKVGDALYQGETVVTGANGETHLSMGDGGYIGVRPNTKMRIDNYKAEGGPDDLSVIGLLQGSFRSVTGWIAKLGGSRYVVRTPTATIGVRGTEHEPLVILEGSKEGEPGTYDRVHIGESVIQTQQGAVSVRPNQAGFAPYRGAVRPRVLDRIPGFFRPTRNEARFAGLHARVQGQLERHREERRQIIEQRRKQLERRKEGVGAVEHGREQRRLQQDQHRKRAQKQREERRARAEKAGMQHAQKQHELQERRRTADEKQRGRRAAKAEMHEEHEHAKHARRVQ